MLVVVFPLLVIMRELFFLALVGLDQLIHFLAVEVLQLLDLGDMTVLNGLDFFFVFDTHVLELVF